MVLSTLGSLVPSALSHLAVRWLHVLGMAVAVGGAVLTWALLRQLSQTSGEPRTLPESSVADATPLGASVTVASAYEWLFWGAAGLLVMTGVGNLGALSPGLPAGAWSATLTAKLSLVAVLLVGSALRTLLLVHYRGALRSDGTIRPPSTRPLGRSYAATALLLAGVVVLAEVLAHG